MNAKIPILKPATLVPLLGLLLLCSCSTVKSASPTLPADVAINPEAGRGGLLTVTLQSTNGENLEFLVDCGSSVTLFDKSYESKLGKALGIDTVQSWGTKKDVNIYAMPKLYFGGILLKTPDRVIAYDLQPLANHPGHPIAGMLSFDTLRHYCIQLDFAAGKMRFLDDTRADKTNWGRAFPIVALSSKDPRPAVAENLLGLHGPHSLIDSGCNFDGWLMPHYYQSWTNSAVPPAQGEARSPTAMFAGEKYPFMNISAENVESDGIGLRFLARHLVTLDFPKKTLYLQRQSTGPLPDPSVHTTPMPALDSLVQDVLQENLDAARKDQVAIEQGGATELEKTVARKLVGTLENSPKPAPADVPPEITTLPLGDAHPELAEVGWLKPTSNRIPLTGEVESPLLDSGKIYATGLFAHAPARYVYYLAGKWKTLRGEAGVHTAFQPQAFGVIFVIKADGKEVYRSAAIRGSDHASYDVDVTGVKSLELLVEKATDRNGGNWSLWLDPTLSR